MNKIQAIKTASKSIVVFAIFSTSLIAASAATTIDAPAEAQSVEPTNSSEREVLGPAHVPVPRPLRNGWMKRHEEFVAEAKKGGVDILFLGDSITDFWRNRGASVWDKYYAPRHALDLGLSADRTQHLLWRIENGELENIHPKVAVLLIGTNNTDKDSPGDIASAIRVLIDDIHFKTPETKILLLAIFPRGPRNNSSAAIAEAAKRTKTIHATNELISKYDDGKTVKYLDVGVKFPDADGKIPKDIMADQLHPTEKGYQIWADAMNPTLDEMMK